MDFKTNLINSYNHNLNKDSIKNMLLISQFNALLNDTLCCYRRRAVLKFSFRRIWVWGNHIRQYIKKCSLNNNLTVFLVIPTEKNLMLIYIRFTYENTVSVFTWTLLSRLSSCCMGMITVCRMCWCLENLQTQNPHFDIHGTI